MHKKRYELDVIRGIFNSNFKLNKFFNNSKKAQVTVFIILGIVILLAFILVFLVKEEIVKVKPEELIPTEKGKVKGFIENCIKVNGEDALFQLGIQGGYIEIPEQIAQDASQHLRVSPFQVIPYWAYGEISSIPPLEIIEERINKYMQENVRSCLFDEEAFQETYNLIEKSDPLADTEILDNKVIFNVRWDLEVKDKNGEVISEVINHAASSPIQFGKIHKTAKKIIERELETLKVEDITQDLLASEHPEVPLAGFELNCQKKSWDVKQVEQSLKDMLRVNIKKLRVEGTEFVDFPDTLPYYQNHYVWNMGDDTFIQKDISAVFNFDNNYPFTFQVTPLEGNSLKSGGLKGMEMLSFLCLQNWKFTYDLMYPVKVRVTDELNNYNFNFAFTVHVIRNMPNRKVPIESRKSHLVNYPVAEEFCQRATVPMTVSTKTLVDNGVDVYDNSEPLEDVEVTFTCLKYSCPLGKTGYNYEQKGFQSSITTNLPYCVGGIMRATKENYKDDWARVVTEDGTDVELNLIPLIRIPNNKFTIVKHDLATLGTPEAKEELLGHEEMALIKLKWHKDGQVEHEIEQVVAPRLDGRLSQGLYLEFLAEADFTYEVEVNVFDDKNIIGGYKGNWTASWNDLQQAEEIVFHVASVDNPSQEEMFELLLDLKGKSSIIKSPEILTLESEVEN